jgi:hypothetical protein
MEKCVLEEITKVCYKKQVQLTMDMEFVADQIIMMKFVQ